MRNDWHFLSYTWGPSCPAYANGKRVTFQTDKCLEKGDSCNTLHFAASNHIGSHIDAPLHFDPVGASVSDLNPQDLVHNDVACIWLEAKPGELIGPKTLEPHLPQLPETTTLIFIRTGSSKWRQDDDYWQAGVGIGKGVADMLRARCPRLKMLGVDSISVASLKHRDLGRVVHREFLQHSERPIYLLEDLNLEVFGHQKISTVIIAPLRIEGGDGAPCTVLASSNPINSKY